MEDEARKEQEMKLPWRRKPEQGAIAAVLTEQEAKAVAYMRASRAVKFLTRERILPVLLYFTLGVPAVHMWIGTQDSRWVLLLFTALAALVLDIWRYDRKRTRWKKEELERMKGSSYQEETTK